MLDTIEKISNSIDYYISEEIRERAKASLERKLIEEDRCIDELSYDEYEALLTKEIQKTTQEAKNIVKGIGIGTIIATIFGIGF